MIAKAKESGTSPFLFIDEIHRFSKSQQDALLGAVEKGIITFIGATTENPSFEVISPLLSRCQIYILKTLDEAQLLRLLDEGKKRLEQQLGLEISIAEPEAILRISGGDARKLLNALELIVSSLGNDTKTVSIDNKNTISIIQQNLAMLSLPLSNLSGDPTPMLQCTGLPGWSRRAKTPNSSQGEC